MNGSWQVVPDENEAADPRKLRSADLRRIGVLAVATTVLAASVGPFSFTRATQSCVGASTSTGSMVFARSSHTATLLWSGKVLVVGGYGALQNLGVSDYDRTVTGSAELYDPTTGTWSLTGSLKSARAFHAAALLPSGKVLVAGGSQAFGTGYEPISSAELYDPATGQWTETGPMQVGGDVFAAIVLPSGKVFVSAGGAAARTYYSNSPVREAQLYDPTSGRWYGIGGWVHPFGSATLLESGSVLVLGGDQVAQLYDPVTGAWKLASNMTKTPGRHTATLLRSGKVLVAGGGFGYAVNPFSSAKIYDPVTNAWTPTHPMASHAFAADATRLPSGEVLVAGGGAGPIWIGRGPGPIPIGPGSEVMRMGPGASIDRYDPATATWTTAGAMVIPRADFTATLLHSGAVLYAGGSYADQYMYASAEIYTLTCRSR